MKLFKLTVLTGPLVLTALDAWAQGGASAVVLARTNGMTAMRDAMSELAPMMQGAVPCDAAAVSSVATTVGDQAGETLSGPFPADTTEGVTCARPGVSSGSPEIGSRANALKSCAEALAKAAPDGLSRAMPMEMDMAGAAAPTAEAAFPAAGPRGHGEPNRPGSGSSDPVIDLALQPVRLLFKAVGNACSSCQAGSRAGRT